MGKVKLFGFELTVTSALLLFIFSLFLITTSILTLAQIFIVYRDTEVLMVGYFFGISILLIFGIIVIAATIKFRDSSRR